jgi:hypothetical protein
MADLPPISVTNAPLAPAFTHVLGIYNDAGITKFARITLANFQTQLSLGGGGVTSWGGITGTLSSQTDLQAVLDGKSNLTHVHALADVTGLTAALAGKQGSLGFTAENIANKGVASGYAALDANGFVPASQLPASFVDDVQEFLSFAAFPPVGTDSIQYVDIGALKIYRWSGSAYTEVSASPGSTDAVPEGATNRYFTVARVIASALTGLSTTTNAVVLASDTILDAIGKLQAQVIAHFGAGGAAHANVSTAEAGFMSPGDKGKLDGVSINATSNASDAALRDRSTHTGSQLAATISDFSNASLANILTGFSTATSTVVVAADSILVAIGKLQAQISLRAVIASPTFTGVPAAPTAALSVSTTQIATTAFVQASNNNGAGLFWTALTADFSGADVATPQPIFAIANDSAALLAATTYEMEGFLWISRTAGAVSHTTGILFGGTATFTSIDYVAAVSAPNSNVLTAVQQVASQTHALTTITLPNTNPTEQILVKISGIVRVLAAGNFIPQFQQSAATGGVPTVKRGSYLKLRPIGTNVQASSSHWT